MTIKEFVNLIGSSDELLAQAKQEQRNYIDKQGILVDGVVLWYGKLINEIVGRG